MTNTCTEPHPDRPTEPAEKQHFRYQVDATQTALQALQQACSLSVRELKAAFDKGAVWLTAASAKAKPVRLRRVKRPLKPGEVIELYYFPKLLHSEPPAPRLLLDRQQYSVWFKPRGMLSQGSKWGDHTALYRWVERHHRFNGENQNRQTWLVHRLDRATAGVQLLAHNKKTAQTLTQLFAEHRIEKHYQAWVHGHFPQRRQTFTDAIDDKPAVTHAQGLHYDAKHQLTLVEIEIETGRKHQIRKHLSGVGFAVVGDRLYGDVARDLKLAVSLPENRRPDLQLTAYQLKFVDPLNGEPIDVVLADAQRALLKVRADSQSRVAFSQNT
ncbi:RluA family pseudouridine synthase [Thiomicrorhabdus sp. zzn3]|uniref:RluA family pseudouridine synthase n=1 Tax=Thiomicrorhabdus sp. zzn3 TaxID=3039775 RepID=UPI00243738E4|nr:RluA family pseudouridine synthase [Thiomicrorhabdus sp. zzn3]MDG6778531.1 RluA family pseudouridine synthase [Thiomicrorhabdus sp. zzn3]